MGKPRAFAACLTSQEMVVKEIRQLHLQNFFKTLCASELHQLQQIDILFEWILWQDIWSPFDHTFQVSQPTGSPKGAPPRVPTVSWSLRELSMWFFQC
jgi:hypothetical protein